VRRCLHNFPQRLSKFIHWQGIVHIEKNGAKDLGRSSRPALKGFFDEIVYGNHQAEEEATGGSEAVGMCSFPPPTADKDQHARKIRREERYPAWVAQSWIKQFMPILLSVLSRSVALNAIFVHRTRKTKPHTLGAHSAKN